MTDLEPAPAITEAASQPRVAPRAMVAAGEPIRPWLNRGGAHTRRPLLRGVSILLMAVVAGCVLMLMIRYPVALVFAGVLLALLLGLARLAAAIGDW